MLRVLVGEWRANNTRGLYKVLYPPRFRPRPYLNTTCTNMLQCMLRSSVWPEVTQELNQLSSSPPDEPLFLSYSNLFSSEGIALPPFPALVEEEGQVFGVVCDDQLRGM